MESELYDTDESSSRSPQKKGFNVQPLQLANLNQGRHAGMSLINYSSKCCCRPYQAWHCLQFDKTSSSNLRRVIHFLVELFSIQSACANFECNEISVLRLGTIVHNDQSTSKILGQSSWLLTATL